ncbi:MAG: phosphoesterase [Acetobacteraceae bacterium]|nr:phosphoesterase [Acetobacteraceae bacterium]
MTRTTWLAGLAATTILASSAAGFAQTVTPQPDPSPVIARYVVDPTTGPALPRDQLIQRLRQRIKYVFVIFNENHSFDNEYGTFPGANGLYSDGRAPRDPAHTPGFVQSYNDSSGTAVTLRPFRIGPEQNATFVDSVDHSHVGLARKLGVKGGVPQMDGFAADEYERFAGKGGAANAAMGTQYARLVMSYIDCDTIPFMWAWASRFTLFDNIFATEDTPSSPNAVAMIAGQAGETQWVKHGAGAQDVSVLGNTGKLVGVPMVSDPQPFYGSQFDTNTVDREPRGSDEESYANSNVSKVLTFASLPLTFNGGNVAEAMKRDRAPGVDLPDIQADIPFIQNRGGAAVNWRWYEEGFDHEPSDAPDQASHFGYVSHHNGAQYFGYIANNPALQPNLRGLGDFFTDMTESQFRSGGVFYIRGGFMNIVNHNPPIQNASYPAPLTRADIATIQIAKRGDDDHPSYSDRQLSEEMAAAVINSIASRPAIWNQSLIIITYDESDGFYDHVAPRILSYGPDGLPLARDIRIPMLVISPYARAHVVSHAEGDHNAVIETVNAIFDLPPLASLPDEKQALLAGEDPQFDGPGGFKQHYLGPRDINTPATDDLLSAFEPGRLDGSIPPLPGNYAMVADDAMRALPHFGGRGCAAIGMTPEDVRQHIQTAMPVGFNTLPSTLPQYNAPR